MIPYIGDFAEDETVYHYFNTFDSNDPSASVTITNLVDADLKVHKDGGVTQAVTDGATISIDFDTITGTHLVTIDTSVDAFYVTGSDYMVRMEGTTVDGATINAALFTFSIQNRYSAGALRPTTAGRTLDVNATGEAGIDLDNTSGTLTSTDITSVAGAVLADSSSDAIIADAVWNALTASYGGAGSYGEALEAVDTSSVTVTTNNDKTGYSLTQAFPTNFADLAITVTTGEVTVGTNNDKTGYTASTVSDKTGYSISGTKTTLDALNDIAAGDVWAVDATSQQTQGTFGQAIGDPVADTTTIYQATVTDATGDNVAIDVVAVQTDLDNGTDGLGAIKTDTAAILDDTGTTGVLVSDGTGAGQIALTAGAVDTVSTVTNQVSADMTAISGDTTAADRLEGLMDGILVCQVNDAAATTTAFAADGFTEATDDHFNGRLITFISGALTGQQTDITDYDAAGGAQGSQQFTVTALTEAPANNDFFVIH